MKKSASFVWTPQDLAALSAVNPPKCAFRLYGLATRLANKRTGLFRATKAWAAAEIGGCKRTADNGFAALVALGVLARAETITNHRQRANLWQLKPRHMWTIVAVHAASRYRAILAKLEAQRVAKRERLQLLNGVNRWGAGTQNSSFNADLSGGSWCLVASEEDIRQKVALDGKRYGYNTDYERQEREVQALLRAQVPA